MDVIEKINKENINGRIYPEYNYVDNIYLEIYFRRHKIMNLLFDNQDNQNLSHIWEYITQVKIKLVSDYAKF